MNYLLAKYLPFFLVLITCTYVAAQPPTLSATSIANNLEGTWVGTCCDFPGSQWGLSPVRLTISLKDKEKSMQWDYVYGIKGKSGYEKKTKYITLYPGKSKMMIQMKGDDRYNYQTQGLEHVAQTGLGQFSAENFDGDSSTYRVYQFNIEKTKFSYRSGTTKDKKQYIWGGWFLLEREGISTP